MPTWDELLRPPAVRPDESADRFCELSGVLFSSGIGKEWLDIVRARFVDRRLPDGSSEAVLREAEAVRGFIQRIERARDRGLKGAAKPT